MQPQKERTFIIIKPDGVQRSLIGEVIKRIERSGLKIAGMKMLVPDKDRLITHYGKDDAWCEQKGQQRIENMKKNGINPDKTALEYGRGIIDALVNYMTVGPVVAMVVEGYHAVAIIRKIVGGTEPLTSDVGTIRGDLTIDSYESSDQAGRAVRNIIHASDSTEASAREIGIWFKPEEVISYRLVQEQILYDVNIDGILE